MLSIDESEAIEAQAAAWHVASFDDAMDWDAFTLWLEADPRHADAYDAIARIDAIVAEHAAVLAQPVVEPVSPSRRTWRMAAIPGGLAAAAALALALLGTGHNHASETRMVASAAAAVPITLADGSQVVLAPRSRLAIAPSQLTLEGAAHFAIRHDPARALTIIAGPARISDIGTTFDVATGSSVRVAVSEGRVALGGGGQHGTIDLGAGSGAILPAGATWRVVGARDLGLGVWTGGAIVYDDAPLAVVAEDLARLSGLAITVDPAIAARRFSGSLNPASGRRAAADLAALVHARLKAHADRLELVAQ